MNKEIFHIYESKLLLSIMIFVLVEPSYFRTIGSIHSIYTMGKYAVLLVVLFLTFYRRKISREILWVFSFYGAILISTIIESGLIRDYLTSICGSLAMCLIFSLWLEKKPDVLLDACKILEIYVYVNLITILLYPDGMYNSGLYSASWFLGFKNPQIRIILPIVCISLIRSYRNKGRISISTLFLLACSALTMVLNGSATGLVGITVFVLLLFMFHKKYKKIPKVLTLTNVVIATIVLFIGIVVFRVQEVFSYLIVGILGKDLDFTNRAGIWNTAIDLIKEKTLIGYGYLNESDYVSLLNYRAATHPHNYFLYIGMNGGLVLAIVVIIGYFRASKKLSENIESVYSKIILFTLCAFLIMGLTESLVGTVLLYPMLILAMKSDVLSSLPYQNKRITIFGKRIVMRNIRRKTEKNTN